MGNVIFVLLVVGFWAIAFLLVVFLIRMSLGSRSDEQEVSDRPEENYETYEGHEGQDNTPALT
ncbi:MAG: hypothetical protein ACLQUY_27005 [Ktedonobacterales bacterium]